ncbi:uncharacterized protein ACA1_058120 [Acanthamoeba castellanii str. Neff]|uniref:Uncharacterized protein n=1 Tax=Acanthamoeba castellanii (strain ATCC 30010 / Neff) TaxID=1257118 RepID=L8GYI6_ACACF|nr:uncharacterized protein ACA1_058120 [Acanthamoeba castellanii str. Neff]ELR17156.1 hypothetical protein ACA1_058120 [Acanthamoeba castellanii str. Neff]
MKAKQAKASSVLPSTSPAPPHKPPAELDWAPAAVKQCTDLAANVLRTNHHPFILYRFVGQVKKANRLPAGVDHALFTRTILAAMDKDPRFKRGVYKGKPCFWASSNEFGPTGPADPAPNSKVKIRVPKPPKLAKPAKLAKAAQPAKSALPAKSVQPVKPAVLAAPPVRLTSEIAIEDSTVDIVTYAQLTQDEVRTATPTTEPPVVLPEQATVATSSPIAAQPPLRFEEPDPPSPLVSVVAPETAVPPPVVPRGAVRGFLLEERSSRALEAGVALADRAAASAFAEAALLGERTNCGHAWDPTAASASASEIYLNTHEPFCLATVGVQGGGKSHTMACVLESCLVPMLEDDVVRLHAPMSALVLHYDQNVTSVCEATGLISPHPALQRLLAPRQLGAAPCLPRDKMVVLVSPSFYRQRRAFYGDYCTVKPLLFRWHTLTADHIKRIMRIKDGDNQLYVAAMLDLLRRYQRDAVVPAFADFLAQVKETCKLNGQRGPLEQRMALLESLVAESAINADIRADGADLYASCQPGTLAIADLTDPLLAAEEANGIFQVLTEQYRALPLRGCGKLLALDEAHKFMDGVAGDGLSEAIVAVARLMRHDGMRLAVSTQSPLALAPELLELVTVAVLHRFHSRDWFTYLAKKLPLSDHAALELATLQPGHALAFASRSHLQGALTAGQPADDGTDGLGIHVFPLRVRGRITADRGASRKNAGAAT